MSVAVQAPRLARRSRGSPGLGRWHVVAVAAIVALLAGIRLAALVSPVHAVDSAAIEARWGIRITQIGVTADGGLIDFRYQVVDADLAETFLESVDNLPVLVAEDSGTVIRSAAMMASGHHRVEAGRTYFLLYRNTNGAIRTGTLVSVVFDELRLEHLPAK